MKLPLSLITKYIILLGYHNNTIKQHIVVFRISLAFQGVTQRYNPPQLVRASHIGIGADTFDLSANY